MCRLFAVERGTYYSWLRRGESKRSIEDREILEEIIDIRKDERKWSYGAPRMQVELKSRNRVCGKNRTVRIMKKAILNVLEHFIFPHMKIHISAMKLYLK